MRNSREKIKYVLKNIMLTIIISIISIFLYIFFCDLKSQEIQGTNYDAKLLESNEEETENSNLNNIEKVSKCVVGISRIKDKGSSAFLINASNDLGLGTGIVISQKGYVLTNQHVSGNVNDICYITTESGETLEGKVVWQNKDIDLAIIKANKKFPKAINIKNEIFVELGEQVYAIGNPIGFDFQRSVTSGIISATNRTVKIKNNDDTYSYMTNLIQTDATINPGNSGGPLINKNGEIIGINTIKITSAEGIGFAVPINIVYPIIEKLEKEGVFKEAYLGIFAYDGALMAYVNDNINLQEGIYIESVSKEGPARYTQLKKGDIIISIDETKVNKMSDLQQYIFSKTPGDEVILKIIREGKEKEVLITLEEKTY